MHDELRFRERDGGGGFGVEDEVARDGWAPAELLAVREVDDGGACGGEAERPESKWASPTPPGQQKSKAE